MYKARSKTVIQARSTLHPCFCFYCTRNRRVPRVNFGNEDTVKYCRVSGNKGRCTLEVNSLDDAERARVIFEGSTEAQNTVSF